MAIPAANPYSFSSTVSQVDIPPSVGISDAGGGDLAGYGQIATAAATAIGAIASAVDKGDEQQAIAAARIAEAQARSSEAMAVQASAAASTSLTSVISQNPMTVAALVLGALFALVYAVRR